MSKKIKKVKVLKKVDEYIVFIETEKDVGLSFIISEFARFQPRGINRLFDQKRYFVSGPNPRYQDIMNKDGNFILGKTLEVLPDFV